MVIRGIVYCCYTNTSYVRYIIEVDIAVGYLKSYHFMYYQIEMMKFATQWNQPAVWIT